MNKTILSLDKQSLILELSRQGKTGYQIIKETKISKNTVYKYLKNGDFLTVRDNKGPLGRKRKIDEKKLNEIGEEIKNKKIKSAKTLISEFELDISERTSRRLLRDLDFKYKKLKKKPFLSERHKLN